MEIKPKVGQSVEFTCQQYNKPPHKYHGVVTGIDNHGVFVQVAQIAKEQYATFSNITNTFGNPRPTNSWNVGQGPTPQYILDIDKQMQEYYTPTEVQEYVTAKSHALSITKSHILDLIKATIDSNTNDNSDANCLEIYTNWKNNL
jgi:hypothetical protein